MFLKLSVLYWVLSTWSLVSFYVIRSRPEANVRDCAIDAQLPTPPTGPHTSPPGFREPQHAECSFYPHRTDFLSPFLDSKICKDQETM